MERPDARCQLFFFLIFSASLRELVGRRRRTRPPVGDLAGSFKLRRPSGQSTTLPALFQNNNQRSGRADRGDRLARTKLMVVGNGDDARDGSA